MTVGDVHRNEMPDELDALLNDLRVAASAVPPPAPEQALAALFRNGAAPVTSPSPARRWAVRAAVAGAVAAFGFGGLGVAGALPDPVQARVADLVEPVGINLPDGDVERPDVPRPTTTTTTTIATTPPPPRVPAQPDTAGRSGRTPGPAEERPGRSGEAPGHTGLTPTPNGPPADAPAAAAVDPRSRADRNPAAAADVDHPDRPGPRPADDNEGKLR